LKYPPSLKLSKIGPSIINYIWHTTCPRYFSILRYCQNVHNLLNMALWPNVLLTSIIGRNATSSSEHIVMATSTKSHMKEKEKYKELEFLSARHELRPRIVHEKRSMHSKNRAGHWERMCHGCVSQQTLSENFLVSAINYDISQTFLVLAAAISKHFLVTTMFCKTVLVLAVSLLSVLFFAVSLLFSVLSTHLNRSLPPPPSSARCTPCCLR